MKKYQGVLYDQCNIRYIEPGVTDIVFFHYTPESFTSPLGKTTLNIRSRIAEYAIARAFLDECERIGYTTHWRECESYREGYLEYQRYTGEDSLVLMRPSEEFLARRIESWDLPIDIIPNRQFLITREEFTEQFEKPPIMEIFYRYMRKSHHILIEDDGKPVGGKWNYDHDNRSFDKEHIPSWSWKPQDIRYIEEAKSYFGRSDLSFDLPVTRSDALSLLEYFLEYHSHDFGRLEDAMYQDDVFVHHSYISTAMNFGLLHPQEVIDRVLGWHMPLSSQEGFVRQILGWREYMRQFYLFYYEDIYLQNALSQYEKIPKSWWSYDGSTQKNAITSMNCVETVVHRVQQNNYSHHIERLMIIGNYALLRGYHPLEVTRWFYEMYTDAFEWVVTPNVMGMSQYSDGGRLATKPYISGGNYIEKMSDYCTNCQYSIKEKTCPMTHLYWDFVDRHQEIFASGRTPYILSTLAKVDIEKIRAAKENLSKKPIHLMRKPWNLPSYPVYSLLTEDGSGKGNMNIMTYITPVSMQPKLYIIALYYGTQSLVNWMTSHRGILQILAPDQHSLVRVLGKKSGKSYDKLRYFEKKGLLGEDRLLLGIAGYIELEEVEKLPDGAGDHALYLCRVNVSRSYHEQVLTTHDLIQAKTIL